LHLKLKRILFVLLLLATAVEVLGVCAGGFEIADDARWRRDYGIEELWVICMLPLVILSVIFQVKTFPTSKKFGKDKNALEEDLFDVWDANYQEQPWFLRIGHLLNAIGLSFFFVYFWLEVGDSLQRQLKYIDELEDLLPLVIVFLAFCAHLMFYWQLIDYRNQRRLELNKVESEDSTWEDE